MGSIVAATMAARLFLAAMLVTALARLPPPISPTPPSHASTGLRHGEMKKGLREGGWEGELGGTGERHRELPRRRSLAGDGGGDGDAGLASPELPLASAKRQVPTGADPIHHNERPPSLPHRHFP